jgi:alginate O-acetyltransferase complex protein AlgI
LPLGLSYFAIRLIEVIFAARAGTLKKVGPIEFFGFMLRPSMLAAGPITTLAEFRRARITDWSAIDYGAGIARCLVGLVKKSSADLLLAPGVLKLAQTVALYPDTASAWTVWPMLLGQLLYIYLDFSGYTDLALGTGGALGWGLPENFNWPLTKSNLQRYRQSWHMTLSNWVMRRVYFPAFMESRSPILAAVAVMPNNLDQVAAAAPKNVEITSVRNPVSSSPEPDAQGSGIRDAYRYGRSRATTLRV